MLLGQPAILLERFHLDVTVDVAKQSELGPEATKVLQIQWPHEHEVAQRETTARCQDARHLRYEPIAIPHQQRRFECPAAAERAVGKAVFHSVAHREGHPIGEALARGAPGGGLNSLGACTHSGDARPGLPRDVDGGRPGAASHVQEVVIRTYPGALDHHLREASRSGPKIGRALLEYTDVKLVAEE